MNGSRVIGFLLLAGAVMLAFPQPSDAQLGGLIRRRVTDAVKGEPTKETAATEEPTNETVTRGDPSVVILNHAVLTGLVKSLETEIALLDKFRQELAAMTTPEQYRACTQKVAMSPEAMKTTMRLAELPENTTPEQMQKLMAEMGQEIQAMTLKACGEDPAKYGYAWRAQRLEDIERQAARAGGFPR